MTLNDLLAEWHNGKPFIEAHTSGSTGAPKAIRLPKADMIASARATNLRFGINATSKLAIPLSMDYIAGKMMAVRSIVAGGCELEVIEPSNKFAYSGSADLLSVVPSQVPHLLANAKRWTCSTQGVIVGGAPLDMALQKELADCGYKAFCSYGMTETCSHVALQPVTGKAEPMTAMPGVTFSQDHRDCLVINAPAYSWQTLVTNDVVRLVSPTEFYWLGRADNVINSGGIKIQAETLESQLAELVPYPLMVRALPDAKWGEVVELVVAAPETARPAIEAAIKHLPDRRQIPKAVTLLPSLPTTPNGKLKRY